MRKLKKRNLVTIPINRVRILDDIIQYIVVHQVEVDYDLVYPVRAQAHLLLAPFGRYLFGLCIHDSVWLGQIIGREVNHLSRLWFNLWNIPGHVGRVTGNRGR